MLDFDPNYVFYPESDGKPMTEGDQQGNAIRLLMAGFRYLYASEPNVHVSGDVMWYPVQGDPRISAAPDVMVIESCARDQNIGRYCAWEHGGQPPRFAIEVLSPSNRAAEMLDKLAFYDRHGVGEYVFIDPFHDQIRAWVRRGGTLISELVTGTWESPFTSVTFGYDDDGLHVFGPDGRRWLSPEAERAHARAEIARVAGEAAQAKAEIARVEREAAHAKAENEALRAELARLRGQG